MSFLAAFGVSLATADANLVSPDLPLFPVSFLHWAQLAMGIFCIWVSFRKTPLSGRDGVPYVNQRLVRMSFRVLGVALFAFAVVGFWIAKW